MKTEIQIKETKIGKYISYKAWFQKKSLQEDTKVKLHHRDAIWSFFVAIGLSEKELESEYDAGLIKFGL